MFVRYARPLQFAALGLTIALTTHRARGAAQHDEFAGVLPYIADDVAAVAYIDLSRLDVKNINAKLGQLFKLSAEELHKAEQVAQTLQNQIDVFKQLGVVRVYLLLRVDDIAQGGPTWVVNVAPGGAGPKIADLLKGLLRNGPHPTEAPLPGAFVVADGCVLAACNEQQLAALAASRRRPEAFRADAQAALNDLGRRSAGLVVFGDADSRRVMREMFPQVPAPFGDLNGDLIADGLKWGGISVDLLAELAMEAAVETRDAATAGRVQQLLTQALELGRAVLQSQAASAPQDFPAELVEAMGLLQPKVDGARVSIALGDEPGELAAIGQLLEQPLRAAREIAVRDQRMNQFKHIALAMLNYESARKSFPPPAIVDEAGRPLLSWRVAILPFLDEAELYNQFRLDEPWDSEHNRRLIDQMPDVFADPDADNRRKIGDAGRTTFVVPTGERTVFRGAAGMKFKEITDGTSQTILAVEVVPERAVIWTQPSDWQVDFSDPLQGVRRADNRWFAVALCDGSVTLIESSVSAETWQKLLTPDGGEVVGDE